MTMALTGAVLTTCGALSLLGRNGDRSPHVWEALARMPALAASGLCVLGLWMFVRAISEPLAERRKGLGRILPALVLLTGAGVGLWFWKVLATQDETYARQAVRAQTEGALRTIVDQMHMEQTGLWRLAKLWEVRGGMTQRDWKIQAGTYIALQPAYRAITKLDPSLTDRWNVSGEGLLERPWADEAPAFQRAVAEAMARRNSVLSPAPPGAEEPEILVAVPIFSEGKPGGAILGSLRLKPLFDVILKDLPLQGYVVSLQNSDAEVYHLGTPDAPASASWTQQRALDLSGISWSVRVSPSQGLLDRLQSPLPEMALGAALLVSFLLSWIVSLSQTNEIRAHLLKSANGKLAEEMMARTRALVLLKSAEEALELKAAELMRSNQELARFASIASHDLQEPLRTVANYMKLLESRYRGRLDAEADTFIRFAVDGTERMTHLIRDLLRYARMDSRLLPFQPTDCNLVLEEALVNLQAAIQEHHAVVTHDILPTVMGDATQLLELFQNMIANAIKFQKNGTPPTVRIGVQDSGAMWTFSICDNGIGVDPQHADRIFTIFERLHTQDEYPGTGIGLAVCMKAVHLHGGRIWVESQAGKGSTFYFTLPKPGLVASRSA